MSRRVDGADTSLRGHKLGRTALSVPSKDGIRAIPAQKTVYLGMSGGVDSSLSAVLLKEQGYKVVGAYMKNWSKDLPGMQCPWAEDLADAKRVAVKLGLDFKVFDFEAEYRQKVVDYMLSEFQQGRTPNPDIMCNQEIKFKLFYDLAREQGADYIATGHYARTDGQNLLRAKDENKDQTYFLYRISEDALKHTIFPVGDMLKTEVKALAAKKGLDNAYKKESMGVCFVGEVGMKDFLKEYLPPQKPGKIIDADTGAELGLHDGAIYYTVGQRRGLNLGGGLPYYIVKKDVKENKLYVSRNLNSADLWTSELELKDVILRATEQHGYRSCSAHSRPFGQAYGLARRYPHCSYAGKVRNVPSEPVSRNAYERSETSSARDDGPEREWVKKGALRTLPAEVRLRHRAELIPAKITVNKNTAKVTFPQKVKSPAPGQSVVFYDGDICLGGGIIA